MKSLVRLIISLGVKLALIALIYAIVMGLTSCRGCSDADALSFSTANNDEVEVVTESSSESVMSDPSNETTPSSSFSQATENNQTTITETTKNSEVASSTQQTSQTTSSTVPAQEPTETTTAAPTTAPTSAQEPTSTPAPTATPVPTNTPTPIPTESPTPEPTATPTPKPYSMEFVCNSEVILTYTWPSIDDYTDEKYNELCDQAEAIVIEKYGEDYLLMNPIHSRTA